MEAEFTHPFARGANLYLTPRLMTVWEECRHDACALEAKRIERDLGVLRQECEAIANAKDWSEFNSASQAVVSDYLKATANIWWECTAVAMRNQSAFGEAFSDVTKAWYSTWTGGFQKAAVTNPAALPLWLKNLAMPMKMTQSAAVQGDASPT